MLALGYLNMSDSAYNHVVYWTIPQINKDGRISNEQHYAVNLSEIDPEDARRLESMLRSHSASVTELTNPHAMRTDPKITEYRHLFKPFIEVKKRAQDLCRFSCVWLPFFYAEYAEDQPEPRNLTHPTFRQLAGTG